jgi:hypothetical protein
MWGIVSVVFGVIELGIGLRFLFELLGATANSTLVAWTYNVTHPLVAPFGTIFGHTAKAVPGTIQHSVFEPAALIALVVYGVIGGILLRILTRPRGV